MPRASTSKPTQEAARPAAPPKPTFFVGWSTTGMERRRSGVVFFKDPHVYEGEPTADQRKDRYIGLGKVEDFPDAKPVSSGVKRLRTILDSRHYGMAEIDLDTEIQARGLRLMPTDQTYRGKIFALEQDDQRLERAKLAHAGVDTDDVPTEGGPKE